ncbi:unnamed protein product [Boreogadus saida]
MYSRTQHFSGWRETERSPPHAALCRLPNVLHREPLCSASVLSPFGWKRTLSAHTDQGSERMNSDLRFNASALWDCLVFEQRCMLLRNTFTGTSCSLPPVVRSGCPPGHSEHSTPPPHHISRAGGAGGGGAAQGSSERG